MRECEGCVEEELPPDGGRSRRHHHLYYLEHPSPGGRFGAGGEYELILPSIFFGDGSLHVGSVDATGSPGLGP